MLMSMLLSIETIARWVGPAMPTPLHIPDGYLSPLTVVVLYVLALPFWWLASQRLRTQLTQRMVPLIALFAAFCFVIMMFNVPLPGGTTGHAVGGTLAAIVLGPWGAVIALSIALFIQAVFFGDGGILAFGANAFNMAILLPLAGYTIYRLLSGYSLLTSRRRVIAAFIAAYVALSLSALAAGIEFGLQPLLFHTADGTPLYSPFPLNIAIPAMLIPHLLVASLVEGIVTALVVAYLQRANLPILQLNNHPAEIAQHAGGWARTRALWVGLAVLAVLSPLGLLAAGTAWGEWAPEEVQGLIGFMPEGLKQISNSWRAPLPDYSIPGLGPVSGYILSAIAGMVLVVLAIWALGAFLHRRPAKTS